MLRGGWEVAVVSCTTAKCDPIHFLLSLYTIQYHNPQHSATVTPNNINQKHTLSRNPPNNDYYIVAAGSLSLSQLRRCRQKEDLPSSLPPATPSQGLRVGRSSSRVAGHSLRVGAALEHPGQP